MEIVHRIQVVSLGLCHGALCFEELQEGRCPEAVALLGQVEELLRYLAVALLDLDDLVAGFDVSVSSSDLSAQSVLFRPQRLFRVVRGHRRLFRLPLPVESGEDRKRDSQHGGQGLPLEVEREGSVRRQDCLLVRGRQREGRTVLRVAGER